MIKNNNDKKIGEATLLVAAILIAFFVIGIISLSKNYKEENVENITMETRESFKHFSVEAKSALVTELNTGKILYAKSENSRQPIASITKLFTSVVASEKLGRIGRESIEIKSDHLTPIGDWGLEVGDNWKVRELIDFTLLTSSNDGAKALAFSAFEGSDDSKFVSEMNTFSRKIGLQDTYFLNETGLDMNLDSEAGAYSSASDITKALKYITFTNPGLFDETTKDRDIFYVGGKIYDSENTNRVVNQLPGIILSKTGYTDLAGGNLAVVVDTGLNNPVAIVVLGSSKEGRFEDVLKLYKETIDYYIK